MSSSHEEKRDPEATRRRLLEAAVRVFAQKGYYGATVDDIVAECGSSKGSFYFHFESKEALFLTLVESFAAMLADEVDRAVRSSPGGGAARIEEAVRAGLGLFERYPQLARVFLIESAAVNPRFEAKRRQLFDRFVRVIEVYLNEAKRNHRLAVADTRLAAAGILGAINEVVLQWLSGPRDRPLQQLAPEVSGFVLRAIGWDSGR